MRNEYPKIYFGPMSKNIVDVLVELSALYPIGLIPSRRQVEHSGGYVNGWTSGDFYSYVKTHNPLVLVCRDHGGRLQGSGVDDGVASLECDAELGFDILHIDPWKKYESLEEVALETAKMIKHCLSVDNKLRFEVGTEEAIHRYTADELYWFLSRLYQLLGEDFSSILYAVVQFGTAIKGTKNVGTFDKERSRRMIKTCEHFGLMSKEHNGDYLSLEDVKERFDLGLSAINIAPEYGVYETTCFVNYFVDDLQLEKLERFFDLCERSKKWEKWMPKINKYEDSRRRPFYDYLICKVCGHYLFNNSEVLKWKQEDPNIDLFLKDKLRKKISCLLQGVYE